MKISPRTSIVISSIISCILIFIIVYVYTNGKPGVIIEVLGRAYIPLIVLAISIRALTPIVHGLSWFLANYICKVKISVRDVIEITLASLFAEYLIPIGGATEVAKATFLSLKTGVGLDLAATTIALHRLSTSLAMFTVTFVSILSLLAIGALHWTLSVVALISLGMVLLNAILFLIIRYKKFRTFLQRLSIKLRLISSTSYTELPSLSLREFLLMFSLSLIERFSVIIAALLVSKALGLELPFPLIVIIFDSIRVIVWLLPLITPGCIGIIDLLQVSILKTLNISESYMAVLVLAVTSITLISNLPIMSYAALRVYGASLDKIVNLIRSAKGKKL